MPEQLTAAYSCFFYPGLKLSVPKLSKSHKEPLRSSQERMHPPLGPAKQFGFIVCIMLLEFCLCTVN